MLPVAAALVMAGACAQSTATTTKGAAPAPMSAAAPSPDPRIGLKAGLHDAGEAAWNLRLVSATPPSERFNGGINSDLAFTGKYAIQGNFNGFQVWDLSTPTSPKLAKAFVCPASQSDVSVYKNLLFVSGEDLSGRLDCGTPGVKEQVSSERIRGIRIFDISDIQNPKYIANVQTCRGSHTHSLLVDPKDPANVYVYISGSSPVRPEAELKGCVDKGQEAGSATFRCSWLAWSCSPSPPSAPGSSAVTSRDRCATSPTRQPRWRGEISRGGCAYPAGGAKSRASRTTSTRWPSQSATHTSRWPIATPSCSRRTPRNRSSWR